MFISRVEINPQRRESKLAAANINRLHAQVLNAFPPREDSASSPLWRLDRGSRSHFLYIVSSEMPDLRAVQEGYGWESSPGVTKPYDDVLESLTEGQVFNFRVNANPVHVVEFGGDGGTSAKRRVPHRTPQHQVNWLRDKGISCGFTLVDETLASPLRVDKFTKNDSGKTVVTIGSVQFDGKLCVSDADALRGALIHGIGRAKAYGCGLLTLA